jgi:hypothetical protein
MAGLSGLRGMERTGRVLLRSSHALSAIEQVNPNDSWREQPLALAIDLLPGFFT